MQCKDHSHTDVIERGGGHRHPGDTMMMMLTVADVAERYGVPKREIRDVIDAERLAAYRIGHVLRFRTADLPAQLPKRSSDDH